MVVEIIWGLLIVFAAAIPCGIIAYWTGPDYECGYRW